MARRATGLVDKHIGHRIRTRRMTLGVSQTDLGALNDIINAALAKAEAT